VPLARYIPHDETAYDIILSQSMIGLIVLQCEIGAFSEHIIVTP
jgi:hypothetical protein